MESIDSDTIKIIHNWSNGGTVKPIEVASNLRREWELDGRFIVGYSGNLGRAHEFETLLEAVEQLKAVPEILFLFIGGGALMEALKQAAVSRRLDNFVFKLYQPREQLRQSLGMPDLHLVVLRPEMEGLIVPSKIYGILAAGKPTLFIGDPLGEIPSILRESDSGVIVESGDSEGLVKQILELRDNLDRVKRMGINARAVFDERYSQSRAFEAWEGIFNSLSE